MKVLSLPGRRHGIAFEPDHYPRVEQHERCLYPSKPARGSPGRAPGPAEPPNAASARPGPSGSGPGRASPPGPSGCPGAPALLPALSLAPLGCSRAAAAAVRAWRISRQDPLLSSPKLHVFCPFLGLLPGDLPACRPSPARSIPGGARGERGLSHAGEGEAAAGRGRGTARRWERRPRWGGSRAEAPQRPRRGGPGGLLPRARQRGPAGAAPGLPRRTGDGSPGAGGKRGTSRSAADGAGKGLPALASSGLRRERGTRSRSLGHGRSATPSRLPEDTVVAGVPGRGDQAVLLVEELLEEGGRHFGALPLPPPPRRWAPRSAVPSPRLVPPAPLHSVSQSYDRN